MFTDNERKIFEYYDGSARVFADPKTVSRRLTIAAGGEPDSILAAWRAEPQMEDGKEVPGSRAARLQAEEKLVEIVRQAFEMVPFDKTTGMGATWDHCIDALNGFLEFWEKNARTVAS